VSLDTYPDIWNRVLLRAPDVGPFIAQDFVRNSFRRVAERRRWSWLIKFSQFISPAPYVTGTVSVTQGSTTVTGVNTAWLSASPTLLYQQFRIGITAPIYTIIQVTDDTHLELSSPFGGATATNTVYRIYQCFFPTPTDYHSMLTLWDPAMNWNLNLNVKQEQLNSWDAQRAQTGNAYMVSYRDTSQYFIGTTPTTPGVPRLELWPHSTSRTFPYLYEARATDISDPGAILPRFIRGDMLLEMSLAEAASYPGTRDKPNAYSNVATARRHDAQAQFLITEAERQDDETDMQDLMQQYGVPAGMAVPFGDANWIQSHSLAFF